MPPVSLFLRIWVIAYGVIANLVLSGRLGWASLHCPGHPIPPLQHPGSHGTILPSGVTCPQNWSFVGSVESS